MPATAAAAAAVEPDPLIVAQLMSMGFGENGSKRAAVATQVRPGLRTQGFGRQSVNPVGVEGLSRHWFTCL